MKMCVETVLPVLLEYNLTNLTIPSLHNATFNSTKNESFTGNILNQTNSTIPNLNTNSSEAKVNLTSPSSRIILPSPSPETWILTSIVPSFTLFTNACLSSSVLKGGESFKNVLKSPISFSFNDKLFIETPAENILPSSLAFLITEIVFLEDIHHVNLIRYII